MSNHNSIQLRLASVPLMALLGACSREVVDLGGATLSQDLQLGSRCNESLIIDESVLVTSQAELEALQGCEEIRGDLTVQFFEGADLSPLDALRAVGGSLVLGAFAPTPDDLDEAAFEAYLAEQQRSTAIKEAGWLPSLHGLESIERIGSLGINGIAAADLHAFESLRNVSSHYTGSLAGQIYVNEATNLVDLSGLENAQGVASVVLTSNPSLESLQGLQVGTDIELVFLQFNARLSNLDALAPLESVTTTVHLDGNGIENLDALAKLTNVNAAVALWNNPELENVDGLRHLRVAEALVFQGNPKLVALPEFPDLQRLDYFKAMGNARLEAVSLNFPSLYSINIVQDSDVNLSAAVIEIGGNAALQSIELPFGFTAAQVLAIYNNESLTRVDLGSLRRLDKLSINGNPNLTQVELGELQTVDSLSVLFNPLLSTAQLSGVRTFESNFEQNADNPAL